MSRKAFEKMDGERLTFTATAKRSGLKSAYKGADIKTWLFVDVRRVNRGRRQKMHRIALRAVFVWVLVSCIGTIETSPFSLDCVTDCVR